MNGLYSLSMIFLASMLSYAVIHHCTIETRWPQRRVHLLFAGVCLMNVLLTLSNLQTLLTTTVAHFIEMQRVTVSLLILMFALLPWFFAEYAGERPIPLLAGFTGLCALLFLVNLTQPYTLLYTEIHGLARIALPWREEIFLPLATISVWGDIGIATALLVNTFGFYILFRRFRRRGKRAVLVMMFATGVLLASIIQGTLARLGIIHLPPLGLFGFVGMLIIMGLTLNYEIREERRHLLAILDHVPAYIYMKDSKGHYIMVNRHFEDIFHVSNATVYGKRDYDIFSREQADALRADDQQAIATRHPLEQEKIITSNGERRIYSTINVPLFYDNGSLFAVCCIATDITKRKHADEDLRQSLSLLRATLESTADGILVVNSAGKITTFNVRFAEMWRLPEEILTSTSDQLALEFVMDQLKDPKTFLDKVQQLYDQAEMDSFDVLKFKDGRVFERYSKPIRIGQQSVGRVWSFHDVTERKQAEEQIVRSLQEKEVLLKEIHHRVKNNMQVICSLLSLQANGITDETVRAKFEESRNQVYTMALIHESLYSSSDLAHIDFKVYLKSLIGGIVDTYKRNDVIVSVDMESIALDVTVGIPCGLLVNELLSNSLKYAFPEGRNGAIRVGIYRNGEGNNVLFVEDNGIGLPDEVDFFKTQSLGLQLVNALTKQIHGTIELSRTEGTRVSIIFPYEEDKMGVKHG